MNTCCGLVGMGGKRSTTTFLAGGGSNFPGTFTTFPGNGVGGAGGASLKNENFQLIFIYFNQVL